MKSPVGSRIKILFSPCRAESAAAVLAAGFAHSRRGAGFTIIETLVAIAVLMLAITAPLTLAERSLASAAAAREEITAFYLAQEAMEYVKNRRDNNVIVPAARGRRPEWLEGLFECVVSQANAPSGGRGENPGCGVDPTARPGDGIRSCAQEQDENCRLYRNDGSVQPGLGGIFGHRRDSRDWVRQPFTRLVQIEEIISEREARVFVTIGWEAGTLGAREFTLAGRMYNWYAR